MKRINIRIVLLTNILLSLILFIIIILRYVCPDIFSSGGYRIAVLVLYLISSTSQLFNYLFITKLVYIYF